MQGRIRLEDRVAEMVHRLPPMPESIDRLLRHPPDTPEAVHDLVGLIGEDPSLCLEFLHLANACGARPGGIDTIEAAVADIGVEPLVQLVGTSFINEAIGDQFASLSHLQDYFAHAREIARSTRLLAVLAGRPPHERDLFVLAGLIHDVGRLVIMMVSGKDTAPLMGTSWDQMASIVNDEKDLVGMNHCDIGRALLRKWDLSPVLQEAVQRHHTPLLQDDFSYPGALIFVAHFVASSDFTGDILSGMLPPGLFARLQLTPTSFDIARQRFREPSTTPRH